MSRILLVDDNGEVRRTLRAALVDRLADVSFGEAERAQEAISALERESWDLVLLDLSLPDRGGLETLREMLRLRPTIPVVVMSFHPEADYAAAVCSLGAAGYVAKGSSPEAIATAITGALRR